MIAISGDVSNLSGVGNQPVLTDTSTHERPAYLGVFCHATTLLVAEKQWILFHTAVDEGDELCQG